jgi:AcrR family transcriptional regulator
MADRDAVGTTLLKAAGQLLVDEGPSALTVRRIASAAGVSTMNVYSRFGGKDGVVEHLFTEGFRRLGEAMTARRDTNNPIADMRACGRAYRKFAVENPALYSVMFDRVVPDFEPSPEAVALASWTLVLLATRVERAMNANALRHADPLQTAGLVWATCHGVVSLELKTAGSTQMDWPRIYENALEMIIKGLSSVSPPLVASAM